MNIVAVDFDGTITPHSFPEIPEAPFDGVRECLQFFRDRGWRIVIHTSRAWSGFSEDNKKYVVEMTEWLDRHGIPFDEVSAEKVPTHFYIDYKAVRCQAESDPNWWHRFLLYLREYPRMKGGGRS